MATSRVFGPGGRYSLGVDYTFKAFPADAHFATLNDLSVFSRDRYTQDNIDWNTLDAATVLSLVPRQRGEPGNEATLYLASFPGSEESLGTRLHCT